MIFVHSLTPAGMDDIMLREKRRKVLNFDSNAFRVKKKKAISIVNNCLDVDSNEIQHLFYDAPDNSEDEVNIDINELNEIKSSYEQTVKNASKETIEY